MQRNGAQPSSGNHLVARVVPTEPGCGRHNTYPYDVAPEGPDCGQSNTFPDDIDSEGPGCGRRIPFPGFVVLERPGWSSTISFATCSDDRTGLIYIYQTNTAFPHVLPIPYQMYTYKKMPFPRSVLVASGLSNRH